MNDVSPLRYTSPKMSDLGRWGHSTSEGEDNLYRCNSLCVLVSYFKGFVHENVEDSKILLMYLFYYCMSLSYLVPLPSQIMVLSGDSRGLFFMLSQNNA